MALGALAWPGFLHAVEPAAAGRARGRKFLANPLSRENSAATRLPPYTQNTGKRVPDTSGDFANFWHGDQARENQYDRRRYTTAYKQEALSLIATDRLAYLDLGFVGDIATMRINGREVGKTYAKSMLAEPHEKIRLRQRKSIVSPLPFLPNLAILPNNPAQFLAA